MSIERVEVPFGTQSLIIETGHLAKQAGGSVTVRCGDTVVLVAACMSNKPKEGIDFFPLMVEYQEKTYAAGKIPGGFFKREGRPSEKETLTARVIDRPIRPLFPKGFFNDVVVTCTVISHDGLTDPDILATIGASAALSISNIPFLGPIGAIRLGMLDGELVVNPSTEQMKESTLEMIVVGREDGIVMIEGGCDQVPEDKVMEALEFGLKELQGSIQAQKDLVAKCGKEKSEVPLILYKEEFIQKVTGMCKAPLAAIYKDIENKEEREAAINDLFSEISADLDQYQEFAQEGAEIKKSDVFNVFDEVQYGEIRKLAFEKQLRVDGRKPAELRDLSSEVNILPRAHGSAVFQRGQTQSLSVVTLGSKKDEQLVETLDDKEYKNFMLHYNFPAFSVGEARGSRGPGRREIGHGVLARKSLEPVLPAKEDFPYTVRLVSEILESNGSSSMASVCGGTLALLAAGVPIKASVAGISIGLISDENNHVFLTDIQGTEDHFGDMDFKVSGTDAGVTGIQLDLKVQKISIEWLREALAQAREARLAILKNMTDCISAPATMSDHSPRMGQINIKPEKIGALIGPGGKMIKSIVEDTGITSIDVNDDGEVSIFSGDQESLDQALTFIEKMMEEPVVGKIYPGTVKRVMDFGCFVEFLPGKEGLVHVSELSSEFVKDIHTVVKEGDEFPVKLMEIDRQKRMNLSRKQAEEQPAEISE